MDEYRRIIRLYTADIKKRSIGGPAVVEPDGRARRHPLARRSLSPACPLFLSPSQAHHELPLHRPTLTACQRSAVGTLAEEMGGDEGKKKVTEVSEDLLSS